MNFVIIGLHCLDMRDFHSHLRETPALDGLRDRSVFIPMGRGQGHNQMDSLNEEITGLWTPRYSDAELTRDGFKAGKQYSLPKTSLEYLSEDGYELFTYIGMGTRDGHYHRRFGSFAVDGGMQQMWLKDEPERMRQFNAPESMHKDALMERILACEGRFCAHVMLRDTHRPWGQKEGLCALAGLPPSDYPEDAHAARQAALDQPDAFGALRRRGLANADKMIAEIMEETSHIDDVTYVIYSNHGEVYDHFRHHFAYATDKVGVVGTSHGAYPYEVVYANMQMWLIPGRAPCVMRGIGRSVDIAPTILALAGIDHPALDGASMLAQFDEGAFPARERIAEGRRCVSLVREDGWKFLSTGRVDGPISGETPRGPEHHRLAVFDLTTDPYEYVNLVETPQGQEVLDWAIETYASLKN